MWLIPSSISVHWLRLVWYSSKNWAGPYMHEIARPGNLALLNITSYQAQALQCLYSSGAPIWLGHMECDRSVETTSWCFWPMVLMPFPRVPYTAHVTNVSVRSQTDQPPVSSLIQQRRLKLFGHIARAAASEDHSRALRASTDRCTSTVSALNFCSGIFFKSLSYLYEAVRTNFSAAFWTFHKFWPQFRKNCGAT